jgi:hypothetical protein
VLRARDGRIYVAWYSDKGGNPDLYLTSTADGRTWTSAIQLTTHPEQDFYPSLVQDERGVFHLVWFRWSSANRGHIWYNSSPDGSTWTPAAETQVTTTPDVEDWVPSLVEPPDGSLLVYFVSALRSGTGGTADLYRARRAPGESQWQVVPVAALNSSTEEDHLPVAARTPSGVSLVWVRYPHGPVVPWLSPRSDLFLATSADGLAWSAPRQVTSDADNVVHLYPDLVADAADSLSVVWLSTRQGSPRVFELPLADVSRYPTGVTPLGQLPAGYSHRLVETTTSGVYLAVWVQGPDGTQDIYYRLIRR